MKLLFVGLCLNVFKVEVSLVEFGKDMFIVEFRELGGFK